MQLLNNKLLLTLVDLIIIHSMDALYLRQLADELMARLKQTYHKVKRQKNKVFGKKQ